MMLMLQPLHTPAPRLPLLSLFFSLNQNQQAATHQSSCLFCLHCIKDDGLGQAARGCLETTSSGTHETEAKHFSLPVASFCHSLRSLSILFQSPGLCLADIDSDEEEDDTQQQQQPAAAPVEAAPASAAGPSQAAEADTDTGRDAPAQQQHQQQKQQAQKSPQVQGDCDASKDQATAAAGSTKQQQQAPKARDAPQKQQADEEMMVSPLVSKKTVTHRTPAQSAAPAAADLQTPAAAATPIQPPAKRQKALNAGFGFAQAGQPRIDPVTGEEIWGEEEEKPTPKPGFISTPAVLGGSKVVAVFGGSKAAGRGASAAAGQGGEEGKGAGSTGAKKKAAAAGGKKGAANGKAAQKNIMSFFGK
jgi:hypothetical protein